MEEVKKLYTALIGKGYTANDLGNEDVFAKKMQDEQSRRELYDYVSSRGDFKIGSYDNYEQRLRPAQVQKPQPVVDAYGMPMQPEESTIEDAPKVEEKPQENLKSDLFKPQSTETPSLLEMGAKPKDYFAEAGAKAMEGIRQERQAREYQEIMKPLSGIEGREQKNVLEERKKQIEAQLNQPDAARNAAARTNMAKALENVDKELQVLNEQQKQWQEQYGSWTPSSARRFREQTMGQTWYDPYAVVPEEYKALATQKWGKEGSEDAYFSAWMNLSPEEREAFVKREHIKTFFSSETANRMQGIRERATTYAQNALSEPIVSVDPRHSASAMAARTVSNIGVQTTKALDKAEEIKQAYKNHQLDENFFAGAYKGMKDGLTDIDNWTGLYMVGEMTNLYDIADKMEKGEALTQTEEDFLDAQAYKLAVEAALADDLGWGYSSGNVTGASVPFMLQMLASPIGGASGKAIDKGFAAVGRRAIDKFGKGILKKLLTKAPVKKVVKGLVGTVGKGIGQTILFGSDRVAAGTMERHLGNEMVAERANEEFNAGVQAKAGEDLGTAFFKAGVSTSMEHISEFAGGAFIDDFTKMVGKKISKEFMDAMGGSVGRRMANAAARQNANKVFRAIANNKWGQHAVKLSKSVQSGMEWDGLLNEYLEEVLNNASNVMIGDMSMEDFTSLEKNAETLLGLAWTSGFFMANNAASRVGGYVRGNIALKRTDRAARQIFTGDMQEKWNAYTQALSQADGYEEVEQLYKGLMADISKNQDKELARAQMSEAAAYMTNYVKMMGMNAATEEADEEEQKTPAQKDIETAQGEGIAAQGTEEELDVVEEMDESYNQLAGHLEGANVEEWLLQYGETAAKQMEAIRGSELDEQTKAMAEAYLTSAQRYEGLLLANQEEVDAIVDEAAKEFDANVNQELGSVIQVLTTQGKMAYVIQGNPNEREDIRLRYEDGTTEPVSHVVVEKVLSQADAQTMRSDMIEGVRKTAVAEVVKRMQGAVPNATQMQMPVGHNVVVDGQAGVVAGVNADGTVQIQMQGGNVVNAAPQQVMDAQAYNTIMERKARARESARVSVPVREEAAAPVAEVAAAEAVAAAEVAEEAIAAEEELTEAQKLLQEYMDESVSLEDRQAIVGNNVAQAKQAAIEAQAEVDAMTESKPKATDYTSIAEFKQAQEQWKAQMQEKQQALDLARQQEATWNEVQSGLNQPVVAEEASEQTGTEAVNDYMVSDEVDENGRAFVYSPNGSIEFGVIGADTGLTPAPILLSEGMITNPSTNDGYGLVHIEARHGDQIRAAGYKSVIEFVNEVAKNYEVIREGRDRNGHQTYMLQLTDKHNNTLMVELSGDGTYWNINTAGIFKTSYGRNRKEVYHRHTTEKQSTETAGVSQGIEQSGTQMPSSMNTPTSSASKDTQSVSTEQTDKGEISEKSAESNVEVAKAEAKNHNSKHDIKALAKEVGVSAKRIQRVIDFANQVGVKMNFANVTRTQGGKGAFTNADNMAKDRTITLSKYQLAKGMAIEWVMGHELTHQIKADGNAANWEAYKQAIINALGQDAFDKRVKEQSKVYREAGAYQDMSANEFVETMQEEVCADAAGDMLLNPDNMNKVMGVPQSLASRIWSTLKDMVAFSTPTRIKQAVDAWHQLAEGKELTGEAEERKHSISPLDMSEEEKYQRGEMLRNAPAVDVQSNTIVATPELSARRVAEQWWEENVPEAMIYDTEVGEVEINKNSIESSLAHRYGQKKLDAITSLVEGFENAVYLGTLPDGNRQEGVLNHYFAYPINYEGQRNYVFCRAMQDANKNRLYVHEVFVEDKITKGNTLQTAASQPHGGISLYRDILANVLSASKDTQSVSTEQTDKKEISEKSAESNVEVTNEEVASLPKNEGEQALFSISTYEQQGREILEAYVMDQVSKGRLTQEQADDIISEMEDIYNICVGLKDKYAPFGNWSEAEVIVDEQGKPVFSVIKANGDYAMNLDFSLVCKKRRTLDAVLREMIDRGIINNYELGQVDMAKINDIIRQHGFETACRLCFVDAKRFRVAQVADVFCEMYNALVDKSDAQLKEISKKEGKSVPGKIARMLIEHPENRVQLSRANFMDSKGFEDMTVNKDAIMKLYNAKKGTGGPKASYGDTQYLNDILGKQWSAESAYEVGGVRLQSFSDYVPRMVFDYIQMVADLSAKGLPVHAYTKEPTFAKQFGLTGIKINLSLVPRVEADGIAPGLDANGEYVWQEGETFPYEEAIAIQNAEGYRENCGTIAVGVSDAHIEKMLSDDNIRMVIPYHKSGLNPLVAKHNNIDQFQDYTNEQNTRDANGNKLTKAQMKSHFNFNADLHKHGNPRLAAQHYLEWCDKKGYIPKFDKFREHPNYYKLLEDFTTCVTENGVDTFVPQGAVTMTFPNEDSAFGSIAELIEEGLEEDAVLEGRRQADLGSIVDDIESEFAGGKKLSIAEKTQQLEEVQKEREEFMNAMSEKYGSRVWFSRPQKTDGFEEDMAKRKELNDRVAMIKKDIETLEAEEQAKAREEATRSWRAEEERKQMLFAAAKEEFGITDEFALAGYMLPDGDLLDFSHEGVRDMDHRSIEGIYPDVEHEARWDYVVDFMNDGAIRIMPESATIEMTQQPTAEQRKRLKDYVRQENGYVIVEINDANGNTMAYKEYDEGTAPNKVLADIDRYFDEGIRFSLSAEEQSIIDAAKANDTYMKAPNGQPTNLNEKQWAQVRTKAFKEWFGDWENDPENSSKVVDENGEPMVVYHYTPNEFTEFDADKIGSSTDVGAFGTGFYFSPSDKFTLYGTNKMALFVNAKNPMLLNDSNAFEAKEPFFKADYKWDNESAQAFTDDVIAKGYDAVYYENRGMDEIVAFSPTQIKSATDNVGTFDAENADIRYSLSTSNKSVARYDKENGTDVKGFFNYLRNGKVAKPGEPKVFYIANAGPLLEQYGIRGKFKVGDFTFSATHTQDEAHNLGIKEWVDVINSLNSPLAITSYKGLPNEYRIYTRALINGETISVGVIVSVNKDGIYLSNVLSAYGRDVKKLLGQESTYLLYPTYNELKREISQVSTTPNSWLNATSTASVGKVTEDSANDQTNEDESSQNIENAKSGEQKFSLTARPAMPRRNEGESIMDYAQRVAAEVERQRAERVMAVLSSEDDSVRKRWRSLYERVRSAINGKNIRSVDKRTLNAIMRVIGEGAESGDTSWENEYAANFSESVRKKMLESAKKRRAYVLGALIDSTEEILVGIEMRAVRDRIDDLLNVKTTAVNQRGIETGKGVDAETQKILGRLRETMGMLQHHKIEDEMHELRSQNWHIRNDAQGKYKEWTKEEKEAKVAENKERLRELKTLLRESLDNVALETIDSIENEISGLTERIGSESLNESDEVLLEILKLRKMMAEYNQSARETMALERDLEETLEKRTRMRREKNETADNQRKEDLKAEIENLTSKIRGLEGIIRESKKNVLDGMNLFADNLESLIKEGRENLRDKIQAEIQRRAMFLRNALHDVGAAKNTPQTMNTGEKDESRELGWFRSLFANAVSNFDYMLQKIATRTFGQDSWLYRQFMLGEEGVMAANTTFLQGLQQAKDVLDAKAREIFGKNYKDVMEEHAKVEDTGVDIIDNPDASTMTRIHLRLSKGQATYVYMLWKMADGRAKLLAQGFDEEIMAQIEEYIGIDLKEWADWIQDEYLPDLRVKYNERYREMFNTDMAAIENYVPIKINGQSIRENIDLTQPTGNISGLQTKNGSLIKRVANVNPIDLSTNAMELILDHVTQMEEFYAYAPVRRDLQYILSSQAFRNRVNANSHGDFARLLEATRIAVRANKPPVDMNDFWSSALSKIQKGLVAKNIAYRAMTAIKQVLAVPSFYAYSQNPRYMWYLTKNIVGGYARNFVPFLTMPLPIVGQLATKKIMDKSMDGSMVANILGNNLRWCLDNIPDFRDRVLKNSAGDIRLEESSLGKLLDKFVEVGMSHNVFVDALTVSVGLKSIYDYEMYRAQERIKKMAYEMEMDNEWEQEEMRKADNLAKSKAILYCEQTQQSGNPALLSPMQTSRNFLLRSVSLYKNSNLGFVRKFLENARDIARYMREGTRKAMVDEYARLLMLEEGLMLDEAKKQAINYCNSQTRKAAMSAAMYGYMLNLIWEWASKGLLGLLAAEDDEEEKTAMEDVAEIAEYAFMPLSGIPFMDWTVEFATEGRTPVVGLTFSQIEEMSKEIKSELEASGIGEEVAIAAINHLMRFGGVDLEVFANSVDGWIRMMEDTGNADDKILALMLILNSPKSNRISVARELYKGKSEEEFQRAIELAGRYNQSPYMIGNKMTERVLSDMTKWYVSDNATEEEKARFREVQDVNMAIENAQTQEDLLKLFDEVSDTELRKKISSKIDQISKPEDTFAEKVDRKKENALAEDDTDMEGYTYMKMADSQDLLEEKRMRAEIDMLKPIVEQQKELFEEYGSKSDVYTRFMAEHGEEIRRYNTLKAYSRAIQTRKRKMDEEGADVQALYEKIKELYNDARNM